MIEIIDVEQGSREWFVARCGIPTASEFKKVLAEGVKKGDPSKIRKDYMYQLADEVIYQDPVESYSNENMANGKIREAEARSIYALENDVIPEQVGFVKNHFLGAGCSPDSFVGTEGLLQIKTSYPRLWVPHVIHGTYPPEHKAQLMGELWVTSRLWCDLMIYWPNRRPHIVRIVRDEEYILHLARAVAAFNSELEAIVAAMRTKFDLKGTLERSAAE